MKTCLIAEIGQAHDGSLGMLHSYIDALADTGIQMIKFQMHIAEAESSPWEEFRIPFSYVDKTRMDYWKRMEFSFEQWLEIKLHCEEKDIEFLVSPFSLMAVEQCEKLQVHRYKIGSGEVNNLLMLDRIASTGKPIILSSGLSHWDELDRALETIRKHHQAVSLMHCTSMYPCPPEYCRLDQIQKMKAHFGLPVGFSDHSGTIFSGIAAVAMGAELLEFHVCFDKRMFGPDSSSSLTIDEVYELVEAIQFTESACSSNNDRNYSSHAEPMKLMFGKSLAVNKNMLKNQIVNKTDLETKKPAGKGIPAADYERLLGKRLLRDLNQFEFINWEDVE